MTNIGLQKMFQPKYYEYIGDGKWQLNQSNGRIRYVRELAEMYEERAKIEQAGGIIYVPPASEIWEKACNESSLLRKWSKL